MYRVGINCLEKGARRRVSQTPPRLSARAPQGPNRRRAFAVKSKKHRADFGRAAPWMSGTAETDSAKPQQGRDGRFWVEVHVSAARFMQA